MSAWIISNASLLKIRAYILTELSEAGLKERLDVTGVDGVNQFIKDLARMNRYAIWCRYEEKVRMPTLDFRKAIPAPGMHQMLKHLHCLRYQCSEGDTEDVHKATWDRLETLVRELEASVIHGSPEYEAAAWE